MVITIVWLLRFGTKISKYKNVIYLFHYNSNSRTSGELLHLAGEGKRAGVCMLFVISIKCQKKSSWCGLNVLRNMLLQPSPDSESQQTQSSGVEGEQFSTEG